MLWSHYLQNMVNDYIFRGVAPSLPATLYFSLTNSDFDETGAGTEVTLVSRLAVTRNTTNFSAAALGITLNSLDLTFTSSAPAVGILTGVAIWDASSSGNFLIYGKFNQPWTIIPGQPIVIKANKGRFSYSPAGECA